MLTTLLTTIMLTPSADAAFIRRGKLKQRKTLTYRVVATTAGDEVDSVSSVRYGEGEDLERTASRLDFSADVDPSDFPAGDDGTVTVGFRLDNTVPPLVWDFNGSSEVFNMLLPPCTATPCEWTTTTISDSMSLKARMVGGEGDVLLELEAVLIVREGVVLDALVDGAEVTPTVTGDSGEVALTLDQVRSRWKGDVEAEETDGTVLLELTALDADGVEVDSLTDTVTLTEGASDGIGRVKLKERKDGSYRITTLTSDTNGDDVSLSTTITDGDGGEIFAATDSTPAGFERHFLLEGEYAQFLDNSLAIGGDYSIDINISSGGSTEITGSVSAGEVVLSEGGNTIWIDDPDPTDGIEIGLLEVAYDAEMEEFTWLVAVAGEDAGEVTGVSLSIEPLSAIEPVNNAPDMALHREWRQWVQTFEASAPITADSPVTLSVQLSDADQGTLDTVGGSTTTGTAYKAPGFGKGTSESTTQASAKPQLL